MSDDVLLAVAEHLDATDRTRLSLMSKRHLDLLGQWRDVTCLLLDHNFAIVAGKTYQHRIEKLHNLIAPNETLLSKVREQCPNVHKVCIQTRLNSAEIRTLTVISPKLKRLSIAADNFLVHDGVRRSVDFSQCTFDKLTTLNILQRLDSYTGVNCQMTAEDAAVFFLPNLQKLCITGVALRAEVGSGRVLYAFQTKIQVLERILSLKNLRKLSLSGCVVDTTSCKSIAAKLGELTLLEELTLPASLYSIHKQDPKNPKGTNPTFSLRNLKSLHTLSMYVQEFNDDHFFHLVPTFFPANLKVLKLYGRTRKPPKSKEYARFKAFKVEMHPCNEVIVRDYKWCVDANKMIRHMQWCYPYIDSFTSTYIAINNALSQPENWQFTSPKLTSPITHSVPMFDPLPSFTSSPASNAQRAPLSAQDRAMEEALNPPDLASLFDTLFGGRAGGPRGGGLVVLQEGNENPGAENANGGLNPAPEPGIPIAQAPAANAAPPQAPPPGNIGTFPPRAPPPAPGNNGTAPRHGFIDVRSRSVTPPPRAAEATAVVPVNNANQSPDQASIIANAPSSRDNIRPEAVSPVQPRGFAALIQAQNHPEIVVRARRESPNRSQSLSPAPTQGSRASSSAASTTSRGSTSAATAIVIPTSASVSTASVNSSSVSTAASTDARPLRSARISRRRRSRL